MKTRMKYFVLVFVILAFFIFNLSGCKGKEEEPEISQKAAQSTEQVKKAEPEPIEEARPDEKEVTKEEIPILKEVEEVEAPKFIWKIKIDNDFITSSSGIVYEERESKLIEKDPSLSVIFSEESSSPFFLLKGREKQYLVDIKGNIRKEIQYPSSDLVIVFNEKSKKVIGKKRGGEVIWEREWEMKYEKSMISPDGSWAILFPTPDPGYTLSAGENIVSIDKNGKELWRLDYTDRKGGLTGWPRFSDNGKKLTFGIGDTLYYASKEKILWKKKFHREFGWHDIDISYSGNFIILPADKIYLINLSGTILWKWDDNIIKEFVPWRYGFSEKEKFLFVLGKIKAPGRLPFFIVVADVQKGEIIKKTKYLIKSESSLYGRIFRYTNSYIRILEDRYLMLYVPGGTHGSNIEVCLYDISHILKELEE